MMDDEKRLMMRSCSTERLPMTSSHLVIVALLKGVTFATVQQEQLHLAVLGYWILEIQGHTGPSF